MLSDDGDRNGGRGPRIAPAPVLAAGGQMRVDVVTVEVVQALVGAGVRPILLKGPTISRWLYQHRYSRGYSDTDLLVSPDAVDHVGVVLDALGFRPSPSPIPFDRPVASRAWVRARDGAAVDVHHSLIGVNVSPERAWAVLSANTETFSVRGVDVEALGPEARAVHVVLHSAQHGRDWQGPSEDVRQAVARLPASLWETAAALARDLDATEAFSAGLRMIPEGVDVARRIGLPAPARADVVLLASSPPPLAVALDWLTRTRGIKAKLALIVRKIALSPEEMRRWKRLARRGRTGLVLAYLWRPFWLTAMLPRALRALRDARAQAHTGADGPV